MSVSHFVAAEVHGSGAFSEHASLSILRSHGDSVMRPCTNGSSRFSTPTRCSHLPTDPFRTFLTTQGCQQTGLVNSLDRFNNRFTAPPQPTNADARGHTSLVCKSIEIGIIGGNCNRSNEEILPDLESGEFFFDRRPVAQETG